MFDSAVDAALVLQGGIDVDLDFGVANLVGSAIGSALTTLVVGAILVAVAPDYTVDRMNAVLDDPVGSFLYGLALFLLLILISILLVFTIVGILVVIPLAILAYVVWAFGAAVAYLAIADRLVGREEGWTKPLLVAAGINGALVLTGVGGLVAFVIGAAGFGAVLENQI